MGTPIFFDGIGVTGALTAPRSDGLAPMLGRVQSDAKAAVSA